MLHYSNVKDLEQPYCKPGLQYHLKIGYLAQVNISVNDKKYSKSF
jgi:hypothetical protein